jgi:hypothetical protein
MEYNRARDRLDYGMRMLTGGFRVPCELYGRFNLKEKLAGSSERVLRVRYGIGIKQPGKNEKF